jgi:hypothetical protein
MYGAVHLFSYGELYNLAAEVIFPIVSREVVYESWILARFARTQLTTADNRAG